MDSQGKKHFLAHREFARSLKWMWFEWDPESLTRLKAYIVVTWDWLKMVTFNQLADCRNTDPHVRNKLAMGNVVADVNSSGSSWELVRVHWPSERVCVRIWLESQLPLLGWGLNCVLQQKVIGRAKSVPIRLKYLLNSSFADIFGIHTGGNYLKLLHIFSSAKLVEQ